MTSTTLIVPQGIGDIYWVYQRFVELYDQLHIRIAVIRGHDNAGKVVRRAEPFVRTWPGVASVDFVEVDHHTYDTLAHLDFQPRWVLDDVEATRSPDGHFFACNGYLEKGTRLESVNADLPTRWDVEFPIAAESDSYTIQDWVENGQPYLAFYISGHTDQPHPQQLGAWPVEKWTAFYRALRQAKPEVADMPVVLIGALYDHAVMRRFVEHAKLLRSTFFLQQSPEQVYHCLDHAWAYVGYQSGLGILADALRCPSLMLYFNSLDGLHYSWCRPEHRDQGIFTAAAFREDPEKVAFDWAARLALIDLLVPAG